MSNLPTVAWQTVVNNVTVVNSTTYTLSIANINPNDPGASSNTVAVGYYIRDWVGHTYSITGINVGGDPLRIQVVDDFLVGIGPQQGRLAYVYKSVGGGMAPYVAPIRYERLDKSAIGYGLPIDLDVLWENSELKATQNTGICAETPIGIQDISIDYSTRVVTIIPPLGYFHYFTDGNGVITKHEVIGPVSFPAFTDTTGTWYFYFDNNGNAVSTQQPWTDFSLIATVLRIVWDNTKTPDSAKALTIFSEYHINDISAIDHAWKHRYGSVWFLGLDIFSNFLTTPSIPNADGRNTVIGLSSGIMLDDNLPFSITNIATPTTFWQQDLGSNTVATLNATNSGIFKVRYKGGAGAGVVENGTRFPFLWDITTNRPQYVNNSGVKTVVTNNNFFVYFVYGIQDGRAGHTVRITPAYNEYINITDANAVTWETVQAQDEAARDTEIRPLYKLVFETKTSYAAGCKYTALRVVTDIRKSVITQTTSSIGSILASNVVYTPFTGIASTNVQALGLELYNKFQGTLNYLPKYNTTGITPSLLNDDGITPKYGANTMWHSGNDGSGSTLDADTVDGYDVQTSLTDINDRLMRVGAFGIGKNSILSNDWDNVSVNGFYYNNSSTAVGIPFVGSEIMMIHNNVSSTLKSQIAFRVYSDRVWVRRKNVTWTAWVEVYHSGNINLATIDFTCKDLTTVTTKIGTLSGYLKGTAGVVGAVTTIPQADVTNLVSDLSNKQPLDATLTSLAAVSGIQGDLLYASGTDTWTSLAKSTTANSFLKNSGTSNNPAWSLISDSDISFTDIITGNASTSKHGYFPKLPTPTGKYLRDDLTWQTISSGGTPGGSDSYVQFNDSGSFGGVSTFTFNKLTGLFKAGISFKDIPSDGNLFIGYTNRPITTGLNNVFTGYGTGGSATSASYNTFYGHSAGGSVLATSRNTFIGNESGYLNTGSNNTFVGDSAGRDNTGDFNTFLGYRAGAYSLGSSRVIIDGVDRTTSALTVTDSLIYGELNSSISLQKLRFNCGYMGFYGTAPIVKPTITGSRGGNAALASLLTQLSSLGLITDSTT